MQWFSQRRVILWVLCLVCAVILVRGDDRVVAGEQHVTSASSSQAYTHFQARHRAGASAGVAAKQQAVAPGRVIVKYKDSLAQCAHCLFSLRRAFQQAAATGSGGLDALHQRYGVRAITPLFRLEAPGSGASQPLDAHTLKAQWQSRVGQAQSRLPRSHDPRPHAPDLYHVYVLELDPQSDLEAFCAQYSADSHVEYCEPDYLLEPKALPNDTYADPDGNGTWSTGAWGQAYEDLWNLKIIKADQAWPLSQGAGVVVAVVDTGVDYLQEDLTEDANGNGVLDPGEDRNANGMLDSNIWVNPGEDINGNGLADSADLNGVDDDGNGYVDDLRGWGFFDGTANTMDVDGHGTHLAGVIAALGNNGRGIIGVAPRAKVMSVRVFDYVLGPYSDLLSVTATAKASQASAGLIYAAEQGARIINNSWGCMTRCSSQVIEDAVRAVHALGAVVTFAGVSGDCPYSVSYSPQRMTDSKPIVVAQTNPWDNAGGRCYTDAAQLDVAAPGMGTQVYSIDPSYHNVISTKAATCSISTCGSSQPRTVGTNYVRSGGTSIAAAHVSGVAALVLSRHPEFTNENVRKLLRATADDVESPGFDVSSGAGRINAARALSVDSVPQLAITTPTVGEALARDAGPIAIIGTASWVGAGSYTLSYGQGAAPTQWVPIPLEGPGTTPVVNGVLGQWDIANLPVERYMLKLVVTISGGLQFDEAVPIAVDAALVRLSSPSVVLSPSLDSFDASGNVVVWEDWRHGNGDLYACEIDPVTLQCPAESPLITDPAPQASPAISGNHIVWFDNRLGPPGNIFRCTYAPGGICAETVQVTGAAAEPSNPDVFGNVIAWTDDRNVDLDPNDYRDDEDSDIYFCTYNPATQQCPEQQIVRNKDPQWLPAVSEKWIAWEDVALAPPDSTNDDNEDIYAYDLIKSVKKQVVGNSESQLKPDVSGNLVVWEDWRNFEHAVYLRDMTTTAVWRLTGANAKAKNPVISGTRIVWVDTRYGNGDIYYCRYDPVSHACPEEALTVHPAEQSAPVISGSLVVWRDDRDGQPALFAYKFNDPPTLDPIPDQTVNEGVQLTFMVSGSDPDGDALSYSASPLPQGASFDALTRTFTWSPGYEMAGAYVVTFTVTDARSLSASKDVQITVNNVPLVLISHAANFPVFSPNGDGLQETTQVAGSFNHAITSGKLLITASDKSLVRYIPGTVIVSSKLVAVWDGKNTAGAVVADGTYTYTLKGVDAGNSWAVGTGSLTIATPDLTIVNLTATPNPPRANVATTLTATVKNSSAAAIAASSLQLRIGAEANPPTYAVPQLSAGATADVNRTYTFPAATSYQVTATIDPLNKLKEKNEANNSTTSTVAVSP